MVGHIRGVPRIVLPELARGGMSAGTLGGRSVRSARRLEDCGYVLTTAIFDLDDTLVDQETAASAAVLAWASEHRIDDAAVVERWRQISSVHYSRYQRRELTFAEQRRARAREFLNVDVCDQEADALFAGYLRRYEAGWTLFDDAVPALRRARSAGLVVAVFTNGNEDHQRLKVDMLGLSNEIDALIASSSLPASKPDPRAFHGALSRLGAQASEALMVGNSPAKDVQGALDVAMQAVLIDRTGRHIGLGVRTVATLDAVEFST